MNAFEKKFTILVKQYYDESGRHDLPWRQTTDPYYILVSEIMLQQTQVERVIPKYQLFILTYPTLAALAVAPLRDVLVLWQGLGYNRRAKALLMAARFIMEKFSGTFPRSRDDILQLPGVGPYTMGAIVAFAFNEAVPIIETNIRTVYLHHFFTGKTVIGDNELMPIIIMTLDTNNPRTWYYALMDYGSYLKQILSNPSKRSKHYTKQTTFAGSDRQIRGAIIHILVEQAQLQSGSALVKLLYRFEETRVQAQLASLVTEGLVMKVGRSYQLPI